MNHVGAKDTQALARHVPGPGSAVSGTGQSSSAAKSANTGATCACTQPCDSGSS